MTFSIMYIISYVFSLTVKIAFPNIANKINFEETGFTATNMLIAVGICSICIRLNSLKGGTK